MLAELPTIWIQQLLTNNPETQVFPIGGHSDGGAQGLLYRSLLEAELSTRQPVDNQIVASPKVQTPEPGATQELDIVPSDPY